jgi:hypothetical protein
MTTLMLFSYTQCNALLLSLSLSHNVLFGLLIGSAFRNQQYIHEFQAAQREGRSMKFYDSVTGVLLFEAAVGRSHGDFDQESRRHGWPSFRDDEVNWEHVRCLKNGECVSLTGTHLVRQELWH